MDVMLLSDVGDKELRKYMEPAYRNNADHQSQSGCTATMTLITPGEICCANVE